MKKRALMALPKLTATDEMKQISASDLPRKEKTDYGYTREVCEYYTYLRCITQDGILKVAFFLPEHLRLDGNNPAYEVYLDKEKRQFITFNSLTQKWCESKLGRLDWKRLYWCAKTYWISEEDAAAVQKYLESDKKAVEAIRQFQRDVREEQLEQRHRRETDPWDKDMEQEKLYVIEEKTYETHIDEEVHLYGLLHQLAFLAGKVKDAEDMANLVETAKHYGEIAEEKFDDWLIPGRYLVFGDRADLSELKAAELTPLTAVLKEHDAKIREKQRAVTADDPAYIISGGAFRMLVGDLFDLLAQYSFLRNRVVEVKTEKRLARLQKSLSGENPSIRRMYRRWGIPDSTGITAFDMLESAIRRTHLTPYDPDGSEDDDD